jgi:hypothetical protein
MQKNSNQPVHHSFHKPVLFFEHGKAAINALLLNMGFKDQSPSSTLANQAIWTHHNQASSQAHAFSLAADLVPDPSRTICWIVIPVIEHENKAGGPERPKLLQKLMPENPGPHYQMKEMGRRMKKN